MARSRSAPRSAASSSHSRAPPPAPPPAAPRATHNTSHNNTQANAKAPEPPQVTNVYVQRGGMGGGGSGILGTMAAVAGGSIIGHGVSNMLFGKENPPTQPAQAQAVAQQYGEGVCGPHIKGYSKCMESNPDNSAACKWAWDYFMQCQDQQPQQQA